jgi:GNAT superfamily N-acetyltransferase
MELVELRSPEEVREGFWLMRQLRDRLSEEQYRERLDAMRPYGFRLLALREDGALVALAGLSVRTTFLFGRHLYVDDLVTDEAARSRGYGAKLMAEIEALARREGCGLIALASGLQREEAHHFYEERMGFRRSSFGFTKRLNGPGAE